VRPRATVPVRRPATSGRRGGRVRAATVGVFVASLLAGCSTPVAEEAGSEGDPSESPIAASVPDPAQVALADSVDDLIASVTAARDGLDAAVDAGSADAARGAAADALTALVHDPDRSQDDPRPLFPSQTLERDDELEAEDQLTRTLTAARDAGTEGGRVLDLLRDPIAGDLGAWQRDPAGMLDAIDAATAAASELEALELAVGELAGLGTRAIAWTRLAAEAGSVDDAAAYAERGVANLDVIVATLDRVELAEEAT
jgi:hypothetical protein